MPNPHYVVRKRKKLDFTVSQLNPIDIVALCACKIHFRIIVPSTGDTKKRELFKNPTNLKKSKKKKLLTEIEPLKLAF